MSELAAAASVGWGLVYYNGRSMVNCESWLLWRFVGPLRGPTEPSHGGGICCKRPNLRHLLTGYKVPRWRKIG